MKYQIIDLDGCISDDRWRRHLIESPVDGRWSNQTRFENYHSCCVRDNLVNAHEIRYDLKHIVLTGRPVRWRQPTEDWLWETANIVPHILIMRNNEDLAPSPELKERMCGWLWEPNLMYGVRKEEIVEAIDDRQDIVSMYHKLGLVARVVRIGDEEHALG
jgi:hypothetical protein